MKKDYAKLALEAHKEWKGKLKTVSKVKVDSRDALSIAYTPGVAAPCLEIAEDPAKSYLYTGRGNTVAVISDGSAVLGLGNIGGLAGMPVMEGKCILMNEFAGLDAVPIVLNTQDADEIVSIVKALAPSFGGINLEDIASPKCFEVEQRLIEACDIPIFHDDQHGTAIVTLAATLNALKIVGKPVDQVKVCLNGPGAAGQAITKLLLAQGVADVVCVDRSGIVVDDRPNLTPDKAALAAVTNKQKLHGGLTEAIVGADIFVGVSKPGTLTKEMIKTMAKDPIVFAMANPTPEIMPEEAYEAGVAVMGTGRSDYPNQINNVLAFPGIFRGAFEVRASRITEEMKLAAAKALADFIPNPTPDRIIPGPFEEGVCEAVAKAVAQAARDCGVARI